MKTSAAVLAALAALVDVSAAHYRFTNLVVNGAKTGDYVHVRANSNHNSPIADVLSKDIVCNAGGLASGAQTQVAQVAAGTTIGFSMDQAIYHDGPVNIYMSKATGDAKTYDGSGNWFKVYELGADISAGAIKFPASGQTQFTFKLPASTPPGDYLVRIEQIGLHSASSKGGAQFYISCAQIKVTGSGAGNPGPTVKFPGAYTGNEPGILINIYYPIPTSWTQPGPKVWTG